MLMKMPMCVSEFAAATVAISHVAGSQRLLSCLGCGNLFRMVCVGTTPENHSKGSLEKIMATASR